MSSYRDRLEGEVNRLGVTFVSQNTGVARNTVYNWLAKGNIPLNYLVVLGSLGADVIYVVTGQRSNTQAPAHSSGSEPLTDEQLQSSNGPTSAHMTAAEAELLQLYSAASLAQQMEAVAVLTGRGKKSKAKSKAQSESAHMTVSGSGHRVAGRDFNETKE